MNRPHGSKPMPAGMLAIMGAMAGAAAKRVKGAGPRAPGAGEGRKSRDGTRWIVFPDGSYRRADGHRRRGKAARKAEKRERRQARERAARAAAREAKR